MKSRCKTYWYSSTDPKENIGIMVKNGMSKSNIYLSNLKLIGLVLVLILIPLILAGCKPENIFSDAEVNYNKAVKLYESKNPWNRRNCFSYFEAVGDQRAINYLIKASEDRDFEMRKGAINSLVKLQGANAAQYVVMLLSDTDNSVRSEAERLIKNMDKTISLYLLKEINTYNKKKKINIIKAMGIVGDISFIDPLGNIIVEEKDPTLSIEAINALGKMKYGIAKDYIAKSFDSGLPQIIVAALNSINKDGSEEFVYTVKPLLGHRNKTVVNAAIEALGNNGNDKAVPLLINKLKECSDNNECIDKTTQALSKTGSENSILYYMQALESPGLYIRQAVLKSAIDVKKRPWAKKVIVTASQNSYSEIKSMALFALKDSSGSKGMKHVVATLNDPDPKVKADAIIALSDFSAARNYKDNYISFLYSKDTNIQMAAIKALTNIKAPWPQEELKRLLRTTQDIDIKMAVLDALVAYGKDRNTVIFIGQYLKDPEGRIADSAIDSLLRIGGIEARREFINNLNDPDPVIRLRSIKALDAIGDFAAISVLQKVVKTDKDENVKLAAKKAVEAIFKRKEIKDNLPISF